MKTRQPRNNIKESTYTVLVRSEDKKRALLETIVYGLVILSTAALASATMPAVSL